MSKDLVAHQAVVVRDEDAKRGEDTRDQRRSWKAGAAILCVALALFGVVVGTRERDAVEPVEVEAEDTKPPYSAVMVGTSSVDSNVVAAEGDAWLYESNRLEWWLDHLPANSQGLVKLHAGQSCDDLGQEHWDGMVAPGPWQSLHWSSNEWGESFGDVWLSELSGVYSFAANLERALVMYSETGDILACGTLDPAPENSNFGVTAELHSGFNPHQEGRVAGEVILGKNNVLTWALYNLGAYAAGSVRLFPGNDCSGSNEAIFSTAWQATEWGIAKGSQVVDRAAHPFYKLVDQAVAVYDQAGALVACDHLVKFAYSIEYEIEEANMELDDILNGLHEDADAYESTSEHTSAPTTGTPTVAVPDSVTVPPTPLATTRTPTIPIVPPTLPPSIQIAPTPAPTESQAATYVATLNERTEEDQCRDAALGYLETQEKLQNTLVELETKAEAFGAALAAVQAGTATPAELELSARFESLKSEEQAHVEAIAVLQSTTAKTCEVNRCHFLYELRESFRTKVDEYNVLIGKLTSLVDEIKKLPEADRTQAQNDTIASLDKVISDKLGASLSIRDGDQAIGAACQEYEFSNCYGTATAQPGCSKLGCLVQRREVGRIALQLVTTRNTLFEKRSKHAEAIEAIESNTTTPAQALLYEEFRGLDKAARNLTSVLEAALRDEPSSCTVAGEVALGEDLILRWRTLSEYSVDTGYFLFNSGSCDFTSTSPLIVMANDENGENPTTTNLNWETFGNSSGSSGSRSLAEVNDKPFSLLVRTSIIAYSLTRGVVACGEFTSQPQATVPQLGTKKLTAQMGDFPDNDQQCRDAGMQMLDAQMRYETNQEELVSRAGEFAAAAEAVLAGVANPDQIVANSRFGLLATQQEGLRSLQAELESTIAGPTCRGSVCEKYHNAYLEIIRHSDERVERLLEVTALIKQLAQLPLEERTSTHNEDVKKLEKEKVGLENSRLTIGYRRMDIGKAISLVCGQYRYKPCFKRPSYNGEFDPVCDELTCFRNKASIGKLGSKLAATQDTLFTKQTEFAAAIASAQADDLSLTQSEHYQEFLSLAATEATTRKLLDEALSRETSTCTIEGSVSLEENLTVRWTLQGYKNEGYVLFHKGKSCDDYEPNALIINALDEYGVNGIANLRWSTVANFTETSGVIDASVVSNEPFRRFESSAAVAVAYNNDYYPVACGEIIS